MTYLLGHIHFVFFCPTRPTLGYQSGAVIAWLHRFRYFCSATFRLLSSLCIPNPFPGFAAALYILILTRFITLSLFALSLFSKRAKKSNSLVFSLLKEQQRANRSFALYKKSDKERFALSLCSKRWQRAIYSFAFYQKSERANKELFAPFLLFCSFLRVIALYLLFLKSNLRAIHYFL